MKKILYIEDDPVSQRIIEAIVQEMGHALTVTESSEEGIALALSDQPDLILLDLMLPGVDGYETALHFRHIDQLQHIPIVMITGHDSGEEHPLANLASIDGKLIKPVDPAMLTGYIQSFIKSGRRTVNPATVELNYSELRRFTHRLVQRLTEKIQDLFNTNHQIKSANQRLDLLLEDIKANNHDLLQMNMLANQILAYSNHDSLCADLPKLIAEQLHIKSVAFFTVNEHEMQLVPFSHYGVHWIPEIQTIDLSRRPFFELVFYFEPLLIDAIWLQAAQRVDAQMHQTLDKIRGAFGTETLYFLPVLGRPKGDQLDCQNTDCAAFNHNDPRWWTKAIGKLNHDDFYFHAKLKEIAEGYFQCCLFPLRGILAFGIGNRRLNENTRPMIQTFVRTIGLTIENIQLYHDVKEAYELAEKQAITDGLTEIYNYRSFHRHLERELKRSIRHWLKMSLIMIDIDFFKHYNDTHGHPAGDRILRQLADVFRRSTRSSDIVARYGGEEFVIILPETPKPAAFKMAEKIRKMVEDEAFPNEHTQPNGSLTISIGVATFPDDAQTVDELIQRADAQLYKAKQTGRNRICVEE